MIAARRVEHAIATNANWDAAHPMNDLGKRAKNGQTQGGPADFYSGRSRKITSNPCASHDPCCRHIANPLTHRAAEWAEHTMS
jgi:hypothetical protein